MDMGNTYKKKIKNNNKIYYRGIISISPKVID